LSALRSADCPEATRACREILSLPLSPGLDPAQADQVVDAVRAFA
jgi:dTDP-4-amino-4,6-dideoxygalactose transaminase